MNIFRKRNYSRGCSKPVNNIAFLKTHKTASSSIQNVILRYGVRNHLHFALTSLRGDLRFHYPSVFRSEFVRKSEKAFNIICHHMRFNYQEVRRIILPIMHYTWMRTDPRDKFGRLVENGHPSFKTHKLLRFLYRLIAPSSQTYSYFMWILYLLLIINLFFYSNLYPFPGDCITVYKKNTQSILRSLRLFHKTLDSSRFYGNRGLCSSLHSLIFATIYRHFGKYQDLPPLTSKLNTSLTRPSHCPSDSRHIWIVMWILCKNKCTCSAV